MGVFFNGGSIFKNKTLPFSGISQLFILKIARMYFCAVLFLMLRSDSIFKIGLDRCTKFKVGMVQG